MADQFQIVISSSEYPYLYFWIVASWQLSSPFFIMHCSNIVSIMLELCYSTISHATNTTQLNKYILKQIYYTWCLTPSDSSCRSYALLISDIVETLGWVNFIVLHCKGHKLCLVLLLCWHYAWCFNTTYYTKNYQCI